MSDKYWQTVDMEDLLRRREEGTTSANVGAYAQPLGEPLRRYPSILSYPSTSVSGDATQRVLRGIGGTEHQRILKAMGWVR